MTSKSTTHEPFLERLVSLILWGETRLFEVAFSLQLIVRLVYGRMLTGYPMLMTLFGLMASLYAIYSAVSDDLAHRHRSTSLMMVFYAAYVYTASISMGFPLSKIAYYTIIMVLPASYLKWRIYREHMLRERLK